MTQQPRSIVILGGGFGGLYTALRLSQLPWEKPEQPEIILVDRNDRFLFSPLLYELLTGELQTWEIAPAFSELLSHTGIRFIQAAVEKIDIAAKQVQLQNGLELSYTHLVLALGGETPSNLVQGAAEYAIGFRTIADAYRLEEKLRIAEESEQDKIRIAIVGAGYSGVELACKLADRLGTRGRLRLIEQSSEILRSSSEYNRETARKALADKGVWIDLETTVDSIQADQISLLYKGQIDPIPVDIAIWTVGIRIPQTLRDLPLKFNPRGQLIVTTTLQTIDYPEIFGVGDLVECQDVSGQKMPQTAQVAIQEADYVAWNVWATLTGRPLLPFHYQQLGEMMTLGINDATLTGLGIKLDGIWATVFRRLAYLYRMPTLDHQLKVGINWMAKPIFTWVLTDK